jgi:hypothetical protein
MAWVEDRELNVGGLPSSRLIAEKILINYRAEGGRSYKKIDESEYIIKYAFKFLY